MKILKSNWILISAAVVAVVLTILILWLSSLGGTPKSPTEIDQLIDKAITEEAPRLERTITPTIDPSATPTFEPTTTFTKVFTQLHQFLPDNRAGFTYP